MARITVPESEIDIYKEGFANKDLLDRRNTGKSLSNVVERVDEPLVIAIDGPWGCGKSFFLKCWVGAHQLENEGKAKAIYFDAFENDFFEDPLVALTIVLDEHLPKDSTTQGYLLQMKTAASKLWRPTTRVLLAAVGANLMEGVGTVADATIEAAGKEAGEQIERVWSKAAGQKEAMKSFRAGLEALTNNNDPEKPQKIVIVIDELDRCRPDYALNLLETAKHFFTVPNVHFVLGVNLKELENSVRARYGIETDAASYLQKFFSISLALPQVENNGRDQRPIALTYLSKVAERMNISQRAIEDLKAYLKLYTRNRQITLRDIDRILSYTSLIPQNAVSIDQLYPGYRLAVLGLSIMRVLAPESFSRALIGKLTYSEAIEALNLSALPEDTEGRILGYIDQVWAQFLAPETIERDDRFQGLFDSFGLRDSGAFNRLVNDYMETITFEIVSS